jgi:hypothetical protein
MPGGSTASRRCPADTVDRGFNGGRAVERSAIVPRVRRRGIGGLRPPRVQRSPSLRDPAPDLDDDALRYRPLLSPDEKAHRLPGVRARSHHDATVSVSRREQPEIVNAVERPCSHPRAGPEMSALTHQDHAGRGHDQRRAKSHDVVEDRFAVGDHREELPLSFRRDRFDLGGYPRNRLPSAGDAEAMQTPQQVAGGLSVSHRLASLRFEGPPVQPGDAARGAGSLLYTDPGRASKT